MDSYEPISKPSIHKRFVAGFVRNSCGELIQCFGPAKNRVAFRWPQIREQILQSRCYNACPNRPWQTTVRTELALETTGDGDGQDRSAVCEYLVFETLKTSTQQIWGIILFPSSSSSSASAQALRLERFFASLILGNLHTCTAVNKLLLRDIDVDAVTASVVDVFDSSLRYVPAYDKWHQGGREVFQQNVRHFVARGQKVEFCLPAFPCKSSCAGKVLSKAPDRGEYMALENLHSYIQGIEAIYKPGGKLWIISDGHVFCDCIGVDDHVVDEYGAHIQAMNDRIVKLHGGGDRIGFKSLPELFTSLHGEKLSEVRDVVDTLPELCHPIPIKMTEEAKMCRKILVAGFQMDDTEIRDLLLSQDASTLALYRGFSKFMLEDLATNSYTRHLSRTQLRKKSAKVAFEMIQVCEDSSQRQLESYVIRGQRNQAYSNLVQLLFPHHVRLSIHAHDNAGPKFGIQMLGRSVIPTDVLPPSGADLDCYDKLHVPTPWHNCVVEIEGEGDPNLYITKSSVPRVAISAGDYVGGLQEDSEGGFVRLRLRCEHI